MKNQCYSQYEWISCKTVNQHSCKMCRPTGPTCPWCVVPDCMEVCWVALLCKVNGACEATLWMKRMEREGAGSLLLTPVPSRAVCNAAVPFHTLVQLVPYFILSVHTAATLIPPLETNYTANHTLSSLCCSPLHFNLKQTEQTAACCIYVHSCVAYACAYIFSASILHLGSHLSTVCMQSIGVNHATPKHLCNPG